VLKLAELWATSVGAFAELASEIPFQVTFVTVMKTLEETASRESVAPGSVFSGLWCGHRS